jgi:phosphoribosylanthranilate isomerase
MIKVKICGITNLDDALAAVEAGYDAIGFVFYKKSSRYIAPPAAKKIVARLPGGVIKIGVFVNEQENVIKKIAKLCKLDILQFHGEEAPEFCRRFKGHKVIKVFRVKDKIDLEKIKQYKVSAYLFDSFSKTRPGGTGKGFNWEILRGLKGIARPIFLSGGLNARNVSKAVAIVHPDWVDVSSSLELCPGRKDHAKVKRFIQAAKQE